MNNLNRDELSMYNHLNDSQMNNLKTLKSEKLQLQYLGEIFDQDTLDSLGIDPMSSWSFEDLIESITND